MIVEALNTLEVESGDTVLIHSDLTALRGEANRTWGEAAEKLKQEVLQQLGPRGTLLVPTFNWDFCWGKPYIHERSMSHLGMFSNSVLFDKRAVRSIHPMFSFAGIGENTGKIFSQIGSSSFGSNSVFERLLRHNIKIILVNCRSDIAFVHYVEQQKKVGYRFMKYFRGDVFVNNENIGGTYDFFARRKSDRSSFNGEGLYKLFIDKGIMKETVGVDGYPVCCVNCQDCDTVLSEKLDHSPNFLRKEN